MNAVSWQCVRNVFDALILGDIRLSIRVDIVKRPIKSNVKLHYGTVTGMLS